MPKQEDMRAQLAGATYFSKPDFKSAFWQVELHPDSRYLTVLHTNDKLYQYARLIMGVMLCSSKTNFCSHPECLLDTYDLIVAAKSFSEHNLALER